MLAIEDVTEMMDVAEMLSRHANEFEERMIDRTERLEKEILKLKTKITS